MRALAGAPVAEALEGARGALSAAGVDSPRLDAELLLAEASGLSRERLIADPEEPLAPSASRRFAELVRRRLRREPLAYIVERKGFRRIELEVDRRVLIPRPETELLVEIALELAPARVLDVGTGSGAVALAIADELPDSEVLATDVSPAALAVARDNSERLGLAARVRFEAGTLPEGGGQFDLLVANLPYVSETEWRGLEPEITEFEPRGALVSGPSGLESIEGLLDGLADRSQLPSALALEVGAGQGPAVAGLVERLGYRRVELRPDLAGIERAVLGR